MEHSFGWIRVDTMENSKQITLKGSVIMFGVMGDNMKENGKITKCTERESSHGRTVEDMMDSMLTIKKKAMESSFGPMEEATKGSGKMESKTAEASTKIKKEFKSQECGVMAKK